MPWPWNSSLLMLYGKRNLFLVDCTSDSWQMTLSLQVSGAETKWRAFAQSVWVCTWRTDACVYRCDGEKNTENITVEDGVICFVLLLPSWPVLTWKRQKAGWEADHFFMLVWSVHFFFPPPLLFVLVINGRATDVFHICNSSRGFLGYVCCNWGSKAWIFVTVGPQKRTHALLPKSG